MFYSYVGTLPDGSSGLVLARIPDPAWSLGSNPWVFASHGDNELILTGSGIQALDDSIFAGLTSITKIDISGNNIMELPSTICAGLNSRLNAAMNATAVPAPLDQPADWSLVREILATLRASEANVTNLNDLSRSKLSRTVQRLTKHEDPAVASAAFALVQAWAGLVLSPWKADAQEVAPTGRVHDARRGDAR